MEKDLPGAAAKDAAGPVDAAVSERDRKRDDAANGAGGKAAATVAYSLSMDSKATWFTEKMGTLLASAAHNPPVVIYPDVDYVARRLMPVEAERLQGFPDDWTNVAVGDGPPPDEDRLKSLGNSMSVPVMRWIGERLQAAVAEAA